MYNAILLGSSAALVLLISLAVLLCACTCCHFKKKKIITNESVDKPQDRIAPIHEEIPPKTMNFQETNIDFKTNVAYSTVKIRSYN
jgi:flagellar basal body-associated protein FliL